MKNDDIEPFARDNSNIDNIISIFSTFKIWQTCISMRTIFIPIFIML